MLRPLRIFLLLLAVVALPAAAQQYFTASTRPTCTDGSPREIWIIDATSATSCTTSGGSTYEAHCCCADGSWSACGGSGGSGSSDRLPSWNNPPASASSLDCEFDGSICSGFSFSSGMSSGTVDPAASIAGGADWIYDFASAPGRLLIQSNGDSVTYKGFDSPTVSMATDFTIFAKFSPLGMRNFSTGAEGEIYIEVTNSSDSNETFACGLTNSGGALYNRCFVQNNGTFTTTNNVGYGPNDATQTAQPQYWLFVVTGASLKFYAGAAEDALVYIGALTKTGVTTGWDGYRFRAVSANETPSTVWLVDFIRYYSSNTFAIWNP